MTQLEYNTELSKIYEDRQRGIDEIYSMYSKGLINENEKESLLRKNDLECKKMIVKLEYNWYFSNKTY
ncbi:hypothetical protein IKO50_05730 [bacterium]|jgi:hypothetical protein|nr:hypothetical protein [bacterium]